MRFRECLNIARCTSVLIPLTSVCKFPAPHFEFPASGSEPRHGDLAMCRATPGSCRLDVFMNRDPRWALGMNETAQRETTQVGIFWVVQTSNGEARLLAACCPLDQAEPYGDCLTYGPGHYETWAHWRCDRTLNPALRTLVRSYEYEVWPRGRIVFDRSRDLFILYADRKLMTPATLARITTQFHLPPQRTEIQSDWHYQSKETPNELGR